LLEELVRRAAEELRVREHAINEALARARRARVLSKQAIIQIHGDNIVEAEARLRNAEHMLHEIKNIVDEYVEIGRFEEVIAAMEEYAEAAIMYGLKTSGEFPRPDAVGLPVVAYLMGLGDVPGELRRQALDALRVGDLERAESNLNTMESIYLSLISMEETPFLRGLRRKIDIARGVIERTRSDLTAEAGRRRLNESVTRLAEKLE